MKIVIIPSADLSYNSGSVIYAKELFEFLLDEGHEVYMLGSCIPKDINNNYKKNIKLRNYLLFHPIIDDRPIKDIQHLKMGADILNALVEIYEEWGGIDVIHAHYASINSYIAANFKYIVNTSVVVSSFGRDINIGLNSNELLKKFIEFSYEYVDKIVVPDIMLKEKIEYLFPELNFEKIEICPMPLDVKIFVDGNFKNVKKDSIVFSTINSCFTKEKGIENIIFAFSKVLKRYGNCILYIAGQDDDDKQANYIRLKELVKELKIKESVIFTGYLSREEVGELLNVSEIFIDARIEGNFSSVLIEAEFKNKVILVSDNDASRKVIIDGENGLLFKKDSIEDLEEKILFLLQNPQKKIQLIDGTKKWCESYGKEYELELCMKKMMRIYQNII